MVRCENGHEYHVCECGFGVLCGSSYAEHKMGCKAVPLWIDSAGVPHYLGEIIGPMFTTSGNALLPWEAPDGNCPICWHKGNPTAEPVLTARCADILRTGRTE